MLLGFAVFTDLCAKGNKHTVCVGFFLRVFCFGLAGLVSSFHLNLEVREVIVFPVFPQLGQSGGTSKLCEARWWTWSHTKKGALWVLLLLLSGCMVSSSYEENMNKICA